MRPVFLILMGLALLLVAWRLARHRSGWPTRVLVAGALLLAIGYGVVLPLYDARILVPLSLVMFVPDADPATALGWHLVKLVSMNGGWFLFGLGLALHARLFESFRKPKSLPALP